MYLFRCGCVEQKDQAPLLRVNPHELQKDAVYPHPLRHYQQPVTAEQTEKHLGLKLQQRPRHIGATNNKSSGREKQGFFSLCQW